MQQSNYSFPKQEKRHEMTRSNGPSSATSFLKQQPLKALKKNVHDMGQLQVDIFPNQGSSCLKHMLTRNCTY